MFSKWELIETNKVMIKESFNVFLQETITRRVLCDVYRKKEI